MSANEHWKKTLSMVPTAKASQEQQDKLRKSLFQFVIETTKKDFNKYFSQVAFKKF